MICIYCKKEIELKETQNMKLMSIKYNLNNIKVAFGIICLIAFFILMMILNVISLEK